MFHWNIFTSSDAARFVLTVPLHYMLLLVTLPALLVGLTFGVQAGRTWRNGVLVAVLVSGYGMLGYSSELTLDRTTGKATLREFEFYHWSTRTYDLDQIGRIYVTTGSTTSQLRLQFHNGKVRSISFPDQYGGKEEVAFKANAFLAGSEARRDRPGL